MSIEVRERRSVESWVLRVGASLLVLLVVLVGISFRSQGKPAMGPRLYKVSALKFRYHGFSRSIKPGLFQVAFTNRESFPFRHEMVVVQLQPGQNVQTVVADAKADGEASEDHYLHFGEIGDVDTGATQVGTFDLAPGTYALACWQDGQPGGGVGEVHAARGMVFTFTVK